MKKLILTLCIAALILVVPAFASTTTVTYPDVSLANWGNGNAVDVWDLTAGNLTLCYTIDMSGIQNPGWSVAEVGLRQMGGANIDPNGIGGWLLSRYSSDASSIPDDADLNDVHMLQKHGWMDQEYDVDENGLIPPVWSNNNYAFWFDRGGVDPFQAAFWNYKDGKTYNTGGVYDVEIKYTNIDATTSTMFATINGEEQGFYTTGYDSANPPDLMPVGRTFTGDMTHMQVFWGRGDGCGTVEITDIKVCYTYNGTTPVPEFPTFAIPAIILIGLIFTAVTIRRMK